MAMKTAETQRLSLDVQCPHCRVAMRLMRRIDLTGMPSIYVFYCQRCQYVETAREEKAVA
jgi:C4-type Zn-finger protein